MLLPSNSGYQAATHGKIWLSTPKTSCSSTTRWANLRCSRFSCGFISFTFATTAVAMACHRFKGFIQVSDLKGSVTPSPNNSHMEFNNHFKMYLSISYMFLKMMTVTVLFLYPWGHGRWPGWQTGLQVFLSIKGHFGDTPGCIAKFQGLEPATALPRATRIGVQWIQLEGPNVCKNKKHPAKTIMTMEKSPHFSMGNISSFMLEFSSVMFVFAQRSTVRRISTIFWVGSSIFCSKGMTNVRMYN